MPTQNVNFLENVHYWGFAVIRPVFIPLTGVQGFKLASIVILVSYS